MSITNSSQQSDALKASDNEYTDESEEEDMNDYYNNNEDDLLESDEADVDIGDFNPSNELIRKRIQELEHYSYSCLTEEKVRDLLIKDAESVASILNISTSLAHLVLQFNQWKFASIIARATVPLERNKMLIDSGVLPPAASKHDKSFEMRKLLPKSKINCGVCFDAYRVHKLFSLSCKHLFCSDCWTNHIGYAVKEGMNGGILCMQSECKLLCPEDFVRQFISGDTLQLYQKHLVQLSVKSHYCCRFCPGVDCNIVLYAETPKPRRVRCTECSTSSCFECGNPYHIPTDCETITKWLRKCADDSETANYISANTKDCPACHICIEKSGGCNHIQCSKCHHNFCWMCLRDWQNHGNSYYECSRYKENPDIDSANQQTLAREALKKYLFYFHRWENHSQSLRLEDEARKRIQTQIETKVNKNEGTWIDWQYLLRAGELLAQCRYTLQYTYPLAYYAETGQEKTLFEYQQAQLEVEIEELAWKLERAGEYQRGDIENQMDVCEKRTQTLLARFVEN